MAKNPRRANGTRRDKLRRKVRDMGLPCALCGKPINYDLPPGDPWSYELDEIIPVSKGGDPLDPDNVQPTHKICNRKKGTKVFVAEVVPEIKHSRNWSCPPS